MEHKDFPDAGRVGRLDLRFRKRESRTILFDSFSKIPLQAFQPFYPDETGCAFTFLINPTGGLVSGDRMEIRIALDENAHAFITSPSATKIYRSMGSPSLQEVEITLKSDSVLEYMPAYTIPFASSDFRQKTTIRMEEGSSAFILDFFTTGRVAMGENLRFREYTSISEIQYCEQLIVSERISLRPDVIDYSGPGFLESFTAVAALYLVFDNPSIEKALTSDLLEILEDAKDISGGVSKLPSNGIIVRMLGHGVQPIERALFEIWTVARRHIINLECPPPFERINIVNP